MEDRSSIPATNRPGLARPWLIGGVQRKVNLDDPGRAYRSRTIVTVSTFVTVGKESLFYLNQAPVDPAARIESLMQVITIERIAPAITPSTSIMTERMIASRSIGSTFKGCDREVVDARSTANGRDAMKCMQKKTWPALSVCIALSMSASGCKTPSVWAYRSLRCVPSQADSSAKVFWDQCPEEPTATQPEYEPVPTPSVEPGPSPAVPRAVDGDQAATSDSDAVSNSKVPVRMAGHVQLADGRMQQDEARGRDQNPLRLPLELPGASTPPLVVPNVRNPDADAQREEVRRLFPQLVPVQREWLAMPDATTGRIGLDELNQLALANHPTLRAAAAAVESARGQVIQAGLPPNPKMGYEADTVKTLDTLGYQGAYLQQTFITARKLGIAAEAAAMDYANAVVDQRKKWVTVTTNVRRAYFQVLSARERTLLAGALLDLSTRAYQAQVELVAAGEAAPYEPLQLRVLTTQARASLILAQQNAIASWRSLAAATGIPDLEVQPLEGHIDCPVPSIRYEEALDRLFAVHTDIRMAENLVRKQRSLVTLADRTPIPNLDVGLVVQRDYTWQPGTYTYNLTLGGEIPALNQNQGNRIAARADLIKADQQVSEVRLLLISQLATAYGTYQANRELADSFKTDALGDQVRAYRGVYQRYLADPNGVSFNDVIVAQQILASVLNQYLDILQTQWQSVVDLGQLLQVDDVFEMGELVDVAPIPELE